MTALTLRLRGAYRRDEDRLWDFYRANPADTLPVPSVSTIRKALQSGSLLVAEDVQDDRIAAAAGYFEYIKSAKQHIVFELAGTRVTKSVGRLSPIPLQQMLLAIRLFQIVTTEDHTKRQVSVISSAKHPRSKENLVALGLSEIASMPRWMDYDTYSWMPPQERNDWRHFIASGTSVGKALEILQQVDFEHGRFQCRGVRKGRDDAGEQLGLTIVYQLPIAALFRPLLAAHERNETICTLSALPDAV
jgi:hypothetical protein